LQRVSAQAAPATPITATGTADRNLAGQAIAITVFSTIRPFGNVLAPIPGRIFLPILFGVTRRIPKLTVTLRQLSFIHFARWSIITKLPYNGAPQKNKRFRYPHMYFESNFNGGWEEYIDAFSHILTRGMTVFWGTSYGFPKPLPTGPFKRYIQDNETEAAHYYCAYPEATSTMIQRALVLDRQFTPLKNNAERMSPDEFAAAYRAFLTDAQKAL
jgi:hypothetical protein